MRRRLLFFASSGAETGPNGPEPCSAVYLRGENKVLVELDKIDKSFGPVHANAHISLRIPPASIMGVLGENGAGKSTLMKILSGYFRPDSGAVILDGKEVRIDSPSDAVRYGIGMLHQDPLDFPPLKVIEDFALGAPGSFFLNLNSFLSSFEELEKRFGFEIDPDSYVDMLTVGERQQLEILRLLSLGAKVLILDEPTTGISLPQKEKLFATLRRLKADGMSILLVSHKLEDVEALCDGAVVLRAGALVGSAKPPFDTDKIITMMFGKEAELEPRKSFVESGNPSAPALETENIGIDAARLRMRGLNIRVRKGEVIGFAGMEGSGQSLLLRACAGLLPPVAGQVKINGENMRGRSYLEYKSRGLAFLPASRVEEGLVPGLSLKEHFVLSEGRGSFIIDRKKALDMANERISLYNIKGTPETKIESLSGGNQQRALLALMREDLKLILVEQPTRGLDIESTMYIWSKLRERCASGAAIVFISTDLDEVLQYSDRVFVFYSGRMSPPLDADSLSAEKLGELIGGKGWEKFAEREAEHA